MSHYVCPRFRITADLMQQTDSQNDMYLESSKFYTADSVLYYVESTC